VQLAAPGSRDARVSGRVSTSRDASAATLDVESGIRPLVSRRPCSRAASTCDLEFCRPCSRRATREGASRVVCEGGGGAASRGEG